MARSGVCALLNSSESPAIPAVSKSLKPCSEPKSTISRWTLTIRNFGVPHTPYKQVDQRVGHRNQIVTAAGMQPGIDHFINGADDKALHQSHVQVLAHQSFVLPALHDLRHQIQVHLGHFPNLLFTHPAETAGLSLVQNRHAPIALKLFQMSFDQQAQFVAGIVRLVDFFAKPTKHLLGLVAEKVHHDIFFILEIKIDGSIGHTGFFGYLADRRLVKTLLGKHFDSRFEDLVILAV